jgi:hypothetical protein
MLAILRHPAVRAALDGLNRIVLSLRFWSWRSARCSSWPVVVWAPVALVSNGKYPIIGAVVDVPLEHVESLLSVSTWPRIVSADGNSSPFFTTYFQPPPPRPANATHNAQGGFSLSRLL